MCYDLPRSRPREDARLRESLAAPRPFHCRGYPYIYGAFNQDSPRNRRIIRRAGSLHGAVGEAASTRVAVSGLRDDGYVDWRLKVFRGDPARVRAFRRFG